MATCDYYKVLDIPKSASDQEIRRAYLKLASIHHPDKNKENELKATEVFKEISKAYEVLSDPVKKANYDQGGQGTSGPGGSRRGFDGYPYDYDSFYEDLFNMFARNFSRGFGPEPPYSDSDDEGPRMRHRRKAPGKKSNRRGGGGGSHRVPCPEPRPERHSTTEILVAQKYIPGLIGNKDLPGSRHIHEFQKQTGASIQMPESWYIPNNNRKLTIKIHGDKAARDKAKKLIEDYVKEQEAPRVEILTIPRAYFNLLRHEEWTILGGSGCNYIKFGDEDRPHLDDSIPRPPPPNMGDTFEIKICGTPERIQMATALIMDRIQDFKDEQNK